MNKEKGKEAFLLLSVVSVETCQRCKLIILDKRSVHGNMYTMEFLYTEEGLIRPLELEGSNEGFMSGVAQGRTAVSNMPSPSIVR